MNFTNIAQMFVSTVSKNKSKELFLYKKNNSWIGLNGTDIKITVEDITFGLRSLGIKEKSNIAILSNNSHRWAMADYGIICSRMSTVTIYPTLIKEHVEFIIKDSDSKLIFVENQEQFSKIKNICNISKINIYIILMDDSLETETSNYFNMTTLFDKGKNYSQSVTENFDDIISKIKESDILTLIYTSGTTGVPKGVALSHKNLISNVEATLKVADFNDHETFLSFLPLSHVLERMGGHFTAFYVGAKIYYSENIEKVSENLLETHPTIVVCVPRLFEKMYSKIVVGLKSAPRIKRLLFNWALVVGRQYFGLKLKNLKIPMTLKIKHKIANKLIYSKIKNKLGGKIKFFVSGGAPLSKEIAEFFASVDITILEGYGLTETSPVLTVNSPIAGIRYGTVGKPLFNVKIKIANDGEILAKGPNIMESYFNNNNATLEVFDKEGWFMTGDIGFLDEDNFLTITDRKKSLIVTSGGKNIAPSPLEGALLNSTYIDQVIVIGDKRNFISALIVPNFEMLINFLNSKKISLLEPHAIIEHEAVISIYNEEVIRLMEKFSNYEKVKKFTLLPQVLSIDKGEMTPKMSIVRKVVEKNYSILINNMYEEL